MFGVAGADQGLNSQCLWATHSWLTSWRNWESSAVVKALHKCDDLLCVSAATSFQGCRNKANPLGSFKGTATPDRSKHLFNFCKAMSLPHWATGRPILSATKILRNVSQE